MASYLIRVMDKKNQIYTSEYCFYRDEIPSFLENKVVNKRSREKYFTSLLHLKAC